MISILMSASTKHREAATRPSRPAKKTSRGKKKDARHPGDAHGENSVSGLTYIEDRGAVYDAPTDVVWDFMEKDETYHPKAHKSEVRNFKGKDISDVTSLLSYEQLSGGRWQKRVCRMTTIRPVARVQEDLVGPYAGSMTVYLYTPRGEKTVVDVFGYACSTELTPAQIKRDRKKVWSNAYTEDLPYFRRFARQHPSVKKK